MHNEALVAELRAASDPASVEQTVQAAGAFFFESLSAYEMLQRVLREGQEQVRAEQRQAALLRRLSGFLGDASLAVDANASVQEVLQLVAEHALDIVDADACRARVGPTEQDPGVLEAVASSGAAGVPDAAAARPVADVEAAPGGPIRLVPRRSRSVSPTRGSRGSPRRSQRSTAALSAPWSSTAVARRSSPTSTRPSWCSSRRWRRRPSSGWSPTAADALDQASLNQPVGAAAAPRAGATAASNDSSAHGRSVTVASTDVAVRWRRAAIPSVAAEASTPVTCAPRSVAAPAPAAPFAADQRDVPALEPKPGRSPVGKASGNRSGPEYANAPGGEPGAFSYVFWARARMMIAAIRMPAHTPATRATNGSPGFRRSSS